MTRVHNYRVPMPPAQNEQQQTGLMHDQFAVITGL